MEPSAELCWILLRAFGPEGRSFEDEIDPARALRLAERFRLGSRIAARQDSTRLAAEVGKEEAKLLAIRMLAVIARERALGRTSRRVAEIAAEEEIPLVLLKFAALREKGVLREGSRGAGDVDVLAAEGRDEELQQALQRHGFEPLGYPGSEHQLPLLLSPLGGGVEVHRSIMGLRETENGPFLTAERLIAEGTAKPGKDLPAGCYLPERELLVAHTLAHGFAQHGGSPLAYPMGRMFSDLVDLGVAGEDDALGDRALGWLSGDMTRTEMRAVVTLSSRLAAGEDVRSIDPRAPDGRLLRHWVAGVLEPGYQQALKLGAFVRPLSAQAGAPRLTRQLWHALVPTRAQLERIYGPAESELGLIGRRLWRPFDLVYRLGKYSISYLRLKAGGRHEPSDEKGSANE